MQKPELKTLITSGVMLVVIILLTCLIRIPMDIMRNDQVSAGVYMHLGDVGIFSAALLLGGPWAALTAALAACLSDLFVGSGVYAVASLIIKAGAAYICAKLLSRERTWANLLRAVAYPSLLALCAYFLYDLIIMNNYSVAALSLPVRFLNGLVNGLIAIPVLKLIDRITYGKSGYGSIQQTGRVK